MFEGSVAFYDAIYDFKDYPAEAEAVHAQIEAYLRDASSLLDVACGTGRHLGHLVEHYEVEGMDVSARMLEKATARLPGVTFHRGDMTSFDLGRTYDVVACLFRSIAYARTLEGMRSAVASMARHVSPGGILLLDPWFTPERYWVGHVAANFAETDGMKISWMYTQKREGDLGILDIHYLVGTADGVEHVEERHEMGLYTHQAMLDAIRDAGLTLLEDPGDVVGRGPFVARRPPEAEEG